MPAKLFSCAVEGISGKLIENEPKEQVEKEVETEVITETTQ